MSIISSETGRINRYIFQNQKPQTYLDLIQKVGDGGKYQKKVLTIFILNWFVTGVILLSNSFLFRNRLYDCQYSGLLLQDVQCLQYVCSLPQDQWKDYLDPVKNDFKNIATLNNYQCQDTLPVIFVRACTYIGATFGFLCISLFTDNFGRKSSLLIAWGICTLGTLLVAFGFDIQVTAIGLFLSGFGSDASVNITYLFFCEIVNNKLRQKYCIIMQIFFAIGALVATTMFLLIEDWRIIWSILVVVPSVIIFVMLFCYVEQTPIFLIKKGIKQALRSLNRIGMINLQRRQTLEEQDIQSVIDFQLVQQFRKVRLNHAALCKFQSLREKTILCSIIAFVVYGMYYGPVLIMENIGFNIYATSYIVIVSQLIIFFPSLIFIQKIKRKKIGAMILVIAIVSSIALVLFQNPSQCGICLDSAFQISIIIIFRASVSCFFIFFDIYVCELFPSRVRGLSFGIIASIGSLSSTITPILLNTFMQNEISAMIIFALTGVIAIGCLNLLPETMGFPLKQQIQQVQLYKMSHGPAISNYNQRKKYKTQHDIYRSRQSKRMIRSQRD